MADIPGTRRDDILNGTNRSDRIWGEQGDDTINGRRGNDEIHGGRGNDIIDGGRGHDKIYAGRGNDIANGGRGRDEIFGDRGNDMIDGGRGNDRLFGERGDDEINGGRGRDFIVGGRGNDDVDGGRGNDYILGDYDPIFFGPESAGNRTDDILRGGAGRDYVDGQVGDDIAIYNLDDNTRSNGRTYRDTYVGGGGEDTLRLEFTADEWANEDLQSDVLAFRDAIEAEPGAEYSFSEFRLTASEFEILEVYVDGEPIDLGGVGGGGEEVVAEDDEYTVMADGSLEEDVTSNDTLPENFFTTLLDGPDKGDLNTDLPEGEFIYTPGDEFRSLAEGQEETVTFTYSAEDAGDPENIDDATVTITVQGVNDDPETIAFARTFSELDGSKAVNLLNSKKVSDVDDGDVLSIQDDSVTVTLGDDTDFTDFIVQNNGRIRIDYSQFDYLNEGESETLTVDYTVTDDKGGTAENTLTITVNGAGEPDPENVAPVANDDAADAAVDGEGIVLKDQDISGNVLANDTDDGLLEELIVSDGTGTGIEGNFGTLTLNEDGSYAYTPNYASDADAPPGIQTVSFEPVGETPADISNWSDGEVTTDESDLGSFLGVFDNESGATGTFTLSGEQQSVVISFDIYEFGQWEASGDFEDTLTITVDDDAIPDDDPAAIFEERFTDNTGKVDDTGDGSEFRTSLGFVDTGFTGKAAVAEVWHYEFAFLTGSDTLELGFLGDLSGGMDNEGWGIDNIQIVERGVDEFAYTASDGELTDDAVLSIDTDGDPDFGDNLVGPAYGTTEAEASA